MHACDILQYMLNQRIMRKFYTLEIYTLYGTSHTTMYCVVYTCTDELLTSLVVNKLAAEVFSLKQHRLLHEVSQKLIIMLQFFS